MQALLLPVGDEWHAVELGVVHEVLRAPPVTPVPNGPAWLIGLVNIRGQIVPVVDTGAPLGLAALGDPTHLAVTDTGGGIAAVGATGAPEPVTLGEAARAGDAPGARAWYDVGDRVVTLLDLDDLLDREGGR